MIRVAICDDQEESLAGIHDAVASYFSRNPDFSVQISDFSVPEQFVSRLRSSSGWDIVVLDICLPGILGTDIAKEIRRRHDRTEIIFISISRDYAIEAFSLKAVHYVVKPFTQAQLDEALSRAISSFEGNGTGRFLVNIGNGKVQSVSVDKILYVESQGYRRVVHSADGLYEETKSTLAKMQEDLNVLSPGQFIQPYRGYIVNLDAIRTVLADRVILHNGDFILIKRGDFRRIRDLLFSWSFDRKDQ